VRDGAKTSASATLTTTEHARNELRTESGDLRWC
jgi:hypothetical protein